MSRPVYTKTTDGRIYVTELVPVTSASEISYAAQWLEQVKKNYQNAFPQDAVQFGERYDQNGELLYVKRQTRTLTSEEVLKIGMNEIDRNLDRVGGPKPDQTFDDVLAGMKHEKAA